MKNHVEEEQLEAFVMNRLAGDELQNVEEHLLFCGTCQDQVQAIERYMAAMQSAARRVRAEEEGIQKEATPAISAGWSWLRTLLHVPIPVWCGAAAMAALLLMVASLPHRERPGAPVDVELQAIRGESTGTALAGHALHLRLDNQGVRYSPAWHIEIVDSEGAKMWTGTGAWSDTAITVAVPRSFTPGTYYVRLIKDTPDPAREFQLVIH
jgi:hypothetical protein